MIATYLAPAVSRQRAVWRWLALASALVALLLPGFSDQSLARADPLATTVVDANIYAIPDWNSPPIGTLPAGTEVQLSGSASPGFVAILFGDGEAWVAAQFLEIGDRPGIDTAVALTDTPLLDAPMRDANVVANVPEGGALILTGASVGGYDAASHEGAGGWVNERDIAQ